MTDRPDERNADGPEERTKSDAGAADVPPGNGSAAPEDESAGDAPRKEVLLYAAGNIENGLANQFPNVLQQILIVVFFINPILTGLVIAVKNLWDSLTDPLMAHITDNTRSRWGRRIPYILFGGVSRMLVLVGIVLFFPSSDSGLSNAYLETEPQVEKAREDIRRAYSLYEQVYAAPEGGSPGREELAAKLEEANRIRADLIGTLPDTVAVIERNLADRERIIERTAGDGEAARGVREKRIRAIDEVRKRLDAARELLADAENMDVLARAAEARVEGAGDSGARIAADRLIENLKLRILDEALERIPGNVERWEVRLAELTAKAGEGDLTGKERSLLEYAREQMGAAERLTERATAWRDRVLAAREALAAGDPDDSSPSLEEVQNLMAEVRDLQPPPQRGERKTMMQNIREGWQAFNAPGNKDERMIIMYLIVAFLVFTTLSTIQSVPYFALGIELCPSYDGRTRVAVYRSFVDKLIGVFYPWVPTLVFLPVFASAIDGLLWVMVVGAVIGITTTILMCMKVRERTRITRSRKRTGFFKSISTVVQSTHFWRVFLLYQIIGITWGIFMQFGFYLNIYWVMESATRGAAIFGLSGTMGWALSLAILPVVNWGCRKYQKHQVLTVAVLLLGLGAGLQWITITPTYPLLQLVNPLFTSVGISSFYVVMASLLADVTDADELKHGERREGMYAAVMAFMGKMVSTVVPVLAGVMLAVSGFDASLEYNQTDRTILNMRLLYSLIPAGLLILGLLLLWRYPLNRARMAEIKAELRRRHDAEEAAGEGGGPAATA